MLPKVISLFSMLSSKIQLKDVAVASIILWLTATLYNLSNYNLIIEKTERLRRVQRNEKNHVHKYHLLPKKNSKL